ncbi:MULTISPECIES: hypothetical protein [unclassified Beijerinckia]|uniref:hypothetical protein n=1 Tax=unclassified Beijerinckia TaxID=2638183 RepID=UPI00089BA3FD|nr:MULTISPECIES: hypothetical protein [unclassified Beijerinckia]MDH7794572.1 hypothetical protein [Beijerinckia sp. GAS462]SEB67031.1 hypothetical protein SAMN05443249_0843 [Beijerinckia sp. 28-YEA-48]
MIIDYADFMWMAGIGSVLMLGIAAVALYALRLHLVSKAETSRDLSTNKPSQQSQL